METTELSTRIHAEAAGRRTRRSCLEEAGLRGLAVLLDELACDLHAAAGTPGAMDRFLPRFARPADPEIVELMTTTITHLRARTGRGVTPYPNTTAAELVIVLAAEWQSRHTSDPALTILLDRLLEDEEIGTHFDSTTVPVSPLGAPLPHLEPANWGRPFIELSTQTQDRPSRPENQSSQS